MTDIRIWKVDEKHMHWAMDCGVHFAMQYPDRIGSRRGCAYTHRITEACVYVYRTKSGQIVVRGDDT